MLRTQFIPGAPDWEDLGLDGPAYRSAAGEAERLTKGARNADYGHPLDDYSKTGWLWSPILLERWVVPALRDAGVELGDVEAVLRLFGPVPAEAAIQCMGQVKVSRELNRPGFDNRADECGYAECLNMVEHERARRARTGGVAELVCERTTD